jgi:hypothetical protein
MSILTTLFTSKALRSALSENEALRAGHSREKDILSERICDLRRQIRILEDASRIKDTRIKMQKDEIMRLNALVESHEKAKAILQLREDQIIDPTAIAGRR